MSSVISVNFDTLSSLCHTFDNLLASGFGPNGKSTLVTTATGQVLITKVGISILRCLHVDHPVGGMIIRSIMKYHSYAGDGSKTFICLLTGIFSRLKSLSYDRSSGRNVCYLNMKRSALYHALHLIQNTWLHDAVFIECKKYALSLDISENESAIQQAMISLVETNLSGKYPRLTSTHLAHTLVDLLCLGCNHFDSLPSLLGMYIDHFNTVCIEVDCRQSSDTSILSGVVIQRDFLHLSDTLAVGPTRFILFQQCFENDSSCSPNPSIFVTKNQQALNASVTAKSQQCSMLVEWMVRNHVKLLISSGRIGDVLNSMCSAASISTVQYVENEDLKRLETVFNIHVIDSLIDLSDTNSHCIVGSTGSCEARIFGRKQFVYIEVPNMDTLADRSCDILHNNQLLKACLGKQLIICGMSMGACQQIRLDMLNALKALRLFVDCEDCDQNLRTCTSTNVQESSRKHAVLLPGGGTFELALYRSLGNFMRSNVNEPVQHCCDALRAALVAVPLRLLQNSFRPSSASLITIEEILRYEDAKIGIDGLTGGRLLEESYVTESLAGKMLLLNSVLELTKQLLRLDGMLSIRRVPTVESAADISDDSSSDS